MLMLSFTRGAKDSQLQISVPFSLSNSRFPTRHFPLSYFNLFLHFSASNT
ncbi:hypothetical protein Hanom_Chr14g01255701 [Helianthus anomalus]